MIASSSAGGLLVRDVDTSAGSGLGCFEGEETRRCDGREVHYTA
jgi:hypothetical protein